MDLTEIEEWIAMTEGKGGIARRDHAKWLIAEVKRLRGKLRVIHTWASFDVEKGQQMALMPADVVRICDKAFEKRRPAL